MFNTSLSFWKGFTMGTVEIHNKLALTVEEASLYSNIGKGKLYELMRNPRCPFVLHVGNKRLIKRKEFEKFISDSLEL